MMRRPKAPAGIPTFKSRDAAYRAARKAGCPAGEVRSYRCDGEVFIWCHAPKTATPEYLAALSGPSVGRYSRVFA